MYNNSNTRQSLPPLNDSANELKLRQLVLGK